jgi:hypothetical protein
MEIQEKVMVRISRPKRPVSGKILGHRIGVYVWNLCAMATDPETGETYRCPSWHKGYQIAERDMVDISLRSLQKIREKYAEVDWFIDGNAVLPEGSESVILS